MSQSLHTGYHITVSAAHQKNVYICVIVSTHLWEARTLKTPHMRDRRHVLCFRFIFVWEAKNRGYMHSFVWTYSYFCSRTLTLSQIQLYSDACPVQGLGGAFPSSHRVTGRVRPLFFVLKCFTLILLVITFNVRVIFPNYINVFFSQGHIFQRSWMILKHKYRTFWELTVIRQH